MHQNHTVCPRSSDPFYIVTYHIKWDISSWAEGMPSNHVLRFNQDVKWVRSSCIFFYLHWLSKYAKTSGSPRIWICNHGTVCPRSGDPYLLYSKLLHKMGHYFLHMHIVIRGNQMDLAIDFSFHENLTVFQQ